MGKFLSVLAVALAVVMQIGIAAAIGQQAGIASGELNTAASGSAAAAARQKATAEVVAAELPVQSSCTTTVFCPEGYGPVFSGYYENGCKKFACELEKTGAAEKASVAVSISVQPQQVDLHSPFQVSGKISYNYYPSPSQNLVYGQKSFKVVTSYRDWALVAVQTKAAQGSIKFSESEGVLEKIMRALVPAKSGSSGSPSGSAGQSDQNANAAARPTATPAQQASVAAISAIGSANSQERVDYITLGPGETASVSAYFTPSTAGVKLVTITVYSQESNCDASQQEGRPCRLAEKQVVQASARVEVQGDSPPLPPQDDDGAVVGKIQLRGGWNMVSVPVDAKVPMADVSGSCGSGSVAWRFTPEGYAKEDTLVPGYGYWVKGTRECDYEVRGGQGASSLAPLSAGWNLVGALGRETEMSLVAGSCSVVSGPWNYNSGQYAYSPALKPGKAYWLKVQGACSLYASGGEMPPAPPQ